jgi:MFS family permease
LFFYGFVGGFLTVGAQMCAVALCAGFYETRLRATDLGWTMGVGRIGAIVGPILGGLLTGAGIAAPTLFVIAGLTSLGTANSRYSRWGGSFFACARPKSRWPSDAAAGSRRICDRFGDRSGT